MPKRKLNKIGNAKEDTFGSNPKKTTVITENIEVLTGTPIIGAEEIVCQARFKCPNCKKGIIIQIRKKIRSNK